MAGRGRGWIRGESTEMRRPGQSSKTNILTKPIKNEECAKVINLIEKLEINEHTTDVELHEIKAVLIDAAKNKKLKEAFDELYDRALDDRQFGIKFAIVFSNKTIYALEMNDGTRLHVALLRELQNTYMNREEIKKQNLNRFRNAVSLLGEVHNRLRFASSPLRILAEPLLEYMKILIDICEEIDIELVTTQVSINGRKIYEKKEKQLEEFMELGKIALINRNLSPRSRGMLLFMLDLAHQRYSPLSGKLQNFYVSQLGTQTFISIQRHSDLLTVNTKSKLQIGEGDLDSVSLKSETKSDTDSIGILMRAPKSENNVKQDSPEKKHVNNDRPTNSGNAPVPRAIRGSGATDQRNMKKSPRERERRDKLTNEQVWFSKQSSSSKVWGHDDRFEKDYE